LDKKFQGFFVSNAQYSILVLADDNLVDDDDVEQRARCKISKL
jgi:hypothetical protein